MTEAISSFEVTGWEPAPYGEDDAGPTLGRATVRKSFQGDLTADSVAELLLCQADPADLAAGAGYVASEIVRGSLAGREGSFVIQHWGLSSGGSQRTGGHVVPGSGTDGLEGLTGEVEISVDADGAHTLVLRYEL